MSVFTRRYGVALAGDKIISIPLLNVAGNDFATDADWTPAAGDVKANGVDVANLPEYNPTTELWDFTLTTVEMQAVKITVLIDDGAGIFDSFIIETFGSPDAVGETHAVSLGAIKRALDIAQDDATNDERLIELENAATAWVQEQTHRRFSAPLSTIERLRGSGTDTLFLSGHMADPVVPDPDFVYATVRDRALGGDSTDWESFTDFERYRDALIRTDGQIWSRSYLYEVTYLNGYHTAPLDVQALIIELIAAAYGADAAVAAGTDGITSERIGDYSYSLGSEAIAGAIGSGAVSNTSWKTLKRWERKFV